MHSDDGHTCATHVLVLVLIEKHRELYSINNNRKKKYINRFSKAHILQKSFVVYQRMHVSEQKSAMNKSFCFEWYCCLLIQEI